MKRYLLILMLFPVLLFSQTVKVQRHFLGCDLEEDSYSVYKRLKIDYDYINTSVDGEYQIYKVRFGGLTWDFVTLYFYREKFYKIIFQNYYSNKKDIIPMYDYISNTLRNKYRDLYDIHENKQKPDDSFLLINDDKTSIILQTSYSRSKSGDYYYYITTTYNDNFIQNIVDNFESNKF